jgi:hypothetical protein
MEAIVVLEATAQLPQAILLFRAATPLLQLAKFRYLLLTGFLSLEKRLRPGKTVRT